MNVSVLSQAQISWTELDRVEQSLGESGKFNLCCTRHVCTHTRSDNTGKRPADLHKLK